jgi:hypothetical protein
VVDTSRRVLGVRLWAHEGSSRLRDAPVADPAIIRRLDVGQAAYIYRGGVTFVQVKRLVAAPAALASGDRTARPGGPTGAERRPSAGTPPGGISGPGQPAPPPNAGPLLDEAFGPEPG